MTDHEEVFAERKRRARVIDALTTLLDGAKPYEPDDFVDVVGRFMAHDEDTFMARQRMRKRFLELTEKLGGETNLDEANELMMLSRLARHQGADWKKAKARHRPDIVDPVPTPEWGNEDELEARLAEKREARAKAEAEREARLDALEKKLAAPAPEPEPAPVYEPNFTIIPDRLAKYAEADESAEDFRKRAFNLLFRFGIAEGENFEGGGEPLTAEEKIRLLPMLIANFEAGNWLRLSEELKPD